MLKKKSSMLRIREVKIFACLWLAAMCLFGSQCVQSVVWASIPILEGSAAATVAQAYEQEDNKKMLQENVNNEKEASSESFETSVSDINDKKANELLTETEKYTDFELEEAKRQLAALTATEYVDGHSVTIEDEIEDGETNLAKNKAEGSVLNLNALNISESQTSLVVGLCLGIGVLLSFYTFYLVYQLKKVNKKAHNHKL